MRGPHSVRSGALLCALAVLGGLPALSVAYQPPEVAPGGTYATTVRVTNFGSYPQRLAARVRLSGDSFYGSPRQAAVHGPWVRIPAESFGPDESADHPVVLTVPDSLPPVLSVEVRQRGRWDFAPIRALVLAEPAGVPPERPDAGRDLVAFRTVGGGRAAFDPDAWGELRSVVARTTVEWDDLRACLGFVSPDSWGLHPDENDPTPPNGGWRAEFASSTPPDMATETLLAFKTPETGSCNVFPRRVWVRSVEILPDGALLCRYSYRVHRTPDDGRPCVGAAYEGRWLLVAIPATDAPVVFRRVP